MTKDIHSHDHQLIQQAIAIVKESALSDSDQECHPIRFQNMHNDVVTVLSDDSAEERNGNILGTKGKLTMSPSGTACVACSGRETKELLVACNLCHSRCIHSYCQDPPLFPWTCIHCKDLRLVYLLNH
ncbi:hypothetical protein Pyn_14339 [Prunus yedoensis var. nudiflora]|uniref:PHD-type domain-containing protein n=1 Tax=Prunus yedoensis var. nudiflora TaxID=2094558 RepID=A0A314UPG2_PRUYE|nr:hypothetical protein Pyn_14339 [Prunus yedoensis var. nudiflora]